ncbi:MAG: hypothetical protein ACOX4D_07815 [Bacteroidales bacterium]|jgi:hypothetical protein
MKNKNLVFSNFIIAVFSITVLFFYSCTKKETYQPQHWNIYEGFGKFTKEVKIYDENNENSAVLLVGSNDESILNMWTSENFTLVPIKEGQSLSEIINLNTCNDETESMIDERNVDDVVTAEISYMIISKDIGADVSNIVLVENPPYSDEMRGWKYSTFYSDAVEGNKVTVNIYGHNFWHRGYYAVSYLQYLTSSWSTIAGEWTQIKNNETKSYTRNPCYKMKARRKYKGSNESVIIEFEN